MLVDERVVTLWSILSVREKTIRDYKHLHKRQLQPLISSIEIDSDIDSIGIKEILFGFKGKKY
jgi:hypothetical protein